MQKPGGVFHPAHFVLFNTTDTAIALPIQSIFRNSTFFLFFITNNDRIHTTILVEVFMNELYLLGDVARKLNVKPYKIAYLYVTRCLPEPELRLGNKRVFSNVDAERIALKLGLEWVPGR